MAWWLFTTEVVACMYNKLPLNWQVFIKHYFTKLALVQIGPLSAECANLMSFSYLPQLIEI